MKHLRLISRASIFCIGIATSIPSMVAAMDRTPDTKGILMLSPSSISSLQIPQSANISISTATAPIVITTSMDADHVGNLVTIYPDGSVKLAYPVVAYIHHRLISSKVCSYPLDAHSHRA